jgi:predicted Zn-dependent peptidase
MSALRFLLPALGLAVPLFAAPVPLLTPDPADPLQAQAWRLDNGLEVWLSVQRDRPQFYAEIAVRVGSKNDPAECTGLAHYLEHLLFKGSPRLGTLDFAREAPLLARIEDLYERHFHAPDAAARAALYAEINRVAGEAAAFAIPNEFDAVYHALGATEVNAHTSHEETVYKAALPAAALGHWARVESDRFAQPVFRLFHTELETVYEEKNQSLDSRFSRLYEAVWRELFPLHPYGQQTTLGEAEHLKRPSLRRIRAFYDAWYVPGNMAILLAGDLDPEATLREIDAAFSAWPARPVPPPTLWLDPGPRGTRRVNLTHPGEELVLIAHRLPPAGHPDEDALLLLDMLLDNRVAGLLNLHLNQTQRVRDSGSHPQFLRDAGAHLIWAAPRDGQTVEEVEALLLEQLERLRQGAFDPELLPAIRADLARAEMERLETPAGRVEMLREAFILGQPWARARGQAARLEKVTAADVIRVARQYFGEARVVGYCRDGQADRPNLPKPALDPLDIPEGRRSPFAAEILARPVPVPAWRAFTEGDSYTVAGSGPRELLRVPNPVNGIFTLRLVLDGGEADDPLLPLALRLVEKCGAGGRSAAETPLAWYRLGARWSHAVDRQETVIELSGLDGHFAEALDLLAAQLREARPETDTWPGLRGILTREREDARKEPAALLEALSEYQLYGDSSRFLRAPSRSRLAELTDRDLLDALARALRRPTRAVYVGRLPLAEVHDRVRAALWRDPLEPALAVPTPPRTPAGSEVLWTRSAGAQTQIRLVVPDGAPAEARVPLAQALNPYLGTGMASLIFQQIREARALAYSAWAAYLPASHPRADNRFQAELGTQGDKTLDALDALAGLLREMPAAPDRFAGTVEGVIRRAHTDPPTFREWAEILPRWRSLGLVGDPRASRLRTLEGLRVADIAAFLRERVTGRAWMIAVCGDPAGFAPAALARFGTVREVRPEELFVE